MVNLPDDVWKSLLKVTQEGKDVCEVTVVSGQDAQWLPWYTSHDGVWQSDPRDVALIIKDDIILYKEMAREDVHLWDLRRARQMSLSGFEFQHEGKVIQLFEDVFDDSVMNEGIIMSMKGLVKTNYFVIDVFQCFFGEMDVDRLYKGLQLVNPSLTSLPFRFKHVYGTGGMAVETKTEEVVDEKGFPTWEPCTFQDFVEAWMEMTV